jgi:hypothetical protein
MQLEQHQTAQDVINEVKQSASLASHNLSSSDKPILNRPPCCGTGCAVCVLDYWEPDELELPAQKTSGAGPDSNPESPLRENPNEPEPLNSKAPVGGAANAYPGAPGTMDAVERPACCGTGCAVCVLDYPEMFSSRGGDSDTLAMLEAVEQAQLQAQRMIVDRDCDTR